MAESEKNISTTGAGLESDIQVKRSRLIVYGSRIAGVYEIGAELQEFLKEKGVTNPQVDICRFTNSIHDAFYDNEEWGDEKECDLPIGVVLLPEMRQSAPNGNMTISVYDQKVDELVMRLCLENNVPLIRITSYKGDYQITEGIKSLLSGE